ncbi:two pore domain potassium channel family protein [Litorivita pollutaquae]|uniref:Two pore domain potassium channel family protein n=1 Tax=Litorivita pollutaquae TaxID=2200892 RepID=A0A2V4MNM2_9RHOB|nr:potassium channel family protein [Litorivita pollutaquae]PYC48331.1 two pore domain potassium channel family protein [Litorivita pollutaquae]
MRLVKVTALLSTVILIIGSGTVFFHHVEGWSWLDSYFFTVVTLSTVGYGSIVPVTAVGKIGTTVFIFVGLGIFAFALQQFGAFTARKREEHTEWLVAQLGHGHLHGRHPPPEPQADNAADAPHHTGHSPKP